MTEPNKAIQEEELEALRAIFEDDWHDLAAKKTAWGTAGEAGWWEVRLHATDDPRISVKLKGRMTKAYPDQPPPLQLIEPTNLTNSHVRTLTKLLQEKAKVSVGAPMIFDLAVTVQEWIAVNHIPLSKPGEVEKTLMEEMALRETAQRKVKEAEKEAENMMQIRKREEQNRLLNERIILDASKKEEKARQALLDVENRQREEKLSSLTDGDLEMRDLVLNEPITVDGHDGSFSKWTLFAGHREALWTSYTAEPAFNPMDGGFVKASPPTVTVQVIDFSVNYYLGAHGKKRIDSLASEVSRLKDVRSANVTRVYAVQRAKSPKGWERLIIVVERLQEGGRLRAWLPNNGFGEDTAKGFLCQILQGLIDLHHKNCNQKQLDPDLVLISPRQQSGEPCLKLSGTGYARRITEYHRSNPFLKGIQEGYPDSWLSPDEVDSPYSYSPKRDVWHAGLIFLQMLFGKDCLWTYPDLHTLLLHVPGGVSVHIMELLSGLLNPNYKKRWTAEDALMKLKGTEEELTHRPSRPTPNQTSASTRSVSAASSVFADTFGKSPVMGQGLASYFPRVMSGGNAVRYSRYRTDFEEVEFLGKGGFGEVVKARNKLDGRPYAIKKVKLRPEDNESRVLREVNTLSRVSHQYIVRYYSCWLEDIGPPEPSSIEDSDHSVTSRSSSADDEDIFAVNFDDLSISRRDHSRSTSFPRIRFRDDDTDDEEDEDLDDSSYESDEVSDSGSDNSADTVGESAQRGRTTGINVPAGPLAKPSMSFTGTTEDDSTVQRILYIQMEFVEKQTLREAITAGLSEEECWRLFVQILQALAHLSSLGIVHRDLKPSNILIDVNGNIKIADFGLSTIAGIAADTSSNSLHTPTEVAEQTSNIGTSLYIAPEVLVSKSYNEKADMYSVGIIFFEMCFAFSTGMERVSTIQAIRKSNEAFPSSWPEDFKPKQREIIALLLRHDPTQRPQATQLLSGPLVPSVDKEQKIYETIITEITNPRSEQYPALIDALFDQHSNLFNTDTRLDDFTYDAEYDDLHHVWQTVTVRRLVEILQRHGAVDEYIPLLIPETTLLNAFPSRSPVRLLDTNGKFVQLPASNLLSMARSASRRLERIKRYHVGQRYIEEPAGGQPRTQGEICFDIVSPIRSSCAEAELLEVLDRLVSECPGPSRGGTNAEYEIHVSHDIVLSTILSAVPVQARPRVLTAFKNHGPGPTVSFGYARSVFSTIPGITKAMANELEQCCVAVEFDKKWGSKYPMFSSSQNKLNVALEEIATIIQLARASGVTRKILFKPALARNAEYFRDGFMFECVRRGKHGGVVVYGGRFDSLLEHFQEPARHSQTRKVYGVGLCVSVDPFARLVRRHEIEVSESLMAKTIEEERSYGFWSPSRCDVYVAATSQVSLQTRLELVGELWRAGIRADLQYDDGRSQEEVLASCMDENIVFCVIARNRPTIKVRNTLRRSEEEIPRNELVNWLRAAIGHQRQIDASYAALDTSTTLVSAPKDREAEAGPSHKNEAKIKLKLPPEPETYNSRVKGKPVRKHRHVSKAKYYDKARDFAASVKSTLPVIGVDLPLNLLRDLTHESGWVYDDDAWRATLAGLEPSERGYADQVRTTVQSYREWGCMWLFSVRENRGYLLQLPAA